MNSRRRFEPDELPPCPCCNGETTLLVSSRDFNRNTTGREFHYFQCRRCGLVFLHPVPDDTRPFYAGGYARIPESAAALREAAAEEAYRMEPVLRHRQGGTLLEIGPWRGVFCANAQDAGFEVSAIEMDAHCVQFLRHELRVDAIQSNDPASTLAGMDRQFDVIALWHSLEHLKQPWKVVEAAAAKLAPGGILLIAQPNIESYEFSLLRERWRHLDAPRHLYFYPAASLTRLCAENGLQLLELDTGDHLSELLAMDTWFEWSKRWFGSGFYSMHLARLARAWARRRERGKEHAGSGMTAVFQKPASKDA